MKCTSAFLVISFGIFATSCSKQNSLSDTPPAMTIDAQKTAKEKDNFRFIVTPEVTGTNENSARIIYLTGHCVITEGHKIDSIAFYEGNAIIGVYHLMTETVIDGTATFTVLAYKQPGTYWLTAAAIDKHGTIIKTETQSYTIE
jgi:hypothetical protein